MKPGLQLYTLSNEFREHPQRTLSQVASLGFGEVEVAGLDGREPRDLRRWIAEAGLICRSGHLVYFGQLDLPAVVDAAGELGLTWLVAPIPWKRELTEIQADPAGGPYAFVIALVNSLTLDDWKWNADLFNSVGERVRAAGLRFAYHNHNFEFRDLGGTRGYDEMLRLTDPDLVKLEMDPGWMRVAGVEPMDYLYRYPGRVRLLHVRDFAAGFAQATRLSLVDAPSPATAGAGVVDYKAIIPAALRDGVEAFFVEREPHPANLEAIAGDYEWLSTRLE